MMLSVIMLSVIMLSVIVQSVIKRRVVAPKSQICTFCHLAVRCHIFVFLFLKKNFFLEN
jgi:hypothetical protein